MTSKYDGIKTAADLVAEVMAHGLSTVQEDICRAQDIFGRTSIEELARLANDTGMNNEQGEPDPKGTWSSSRKATQRTFYFIAFTIWNWQDAVNFFNNYTDPTKEENRRLTKENNELRTELQELAQSYSRYQQKAEADREQAASKEYDLVNENAALHDKIETHAQEILELKAKLYDLLNK